MVRKETQSNGLKLLITLMYSLNKGEDVSHHIVRS